MTKYVSGAWPFRLSPLVNIATIKKSYTLLLQDANDYLEHNILLQFFSAFKKVSCRESRACEVSGFRHRSDNMESTWDLGLWGSLDEAAGS